MENIVQGQWFRGPSADLGDTIEQSLRFPTNAGSERLEWATGPSTTTSWTVSFWMKLGQVGQAIDGTIWQASGASSGPGLYINHNSAAGSDMGVLKDPYNRYSSGRSLRDPSAWYHIVHTFHASGGTNRVRIYINGETALDTTGVGATIDPGKFRIGGNAQWPQPQFQGYMAEWHFVSDNGNLTAADFGRTNDDGIWVPQDYTGSHGSDGFYLKFDSSGFNGSGGIGADHSGNGNHFTATGFDTTAISSSNFDNDIDYNDTPTSNYSVVNPEGVPTQADTAAANLQIVSSSGWRTAYGTVEMVSGKWYWECYIDDVSGGILLGVGNYDSYVNDTAVHYIGDAAGGFGYYSQTGDKYNASMASPGYGSYGNSYTTGDVIGFAFDADTKTLWASKDGTWQNSATLTEVQDGTTTNAMFTSMAGDRFLPALSSSGTAAIAQVNYGQRPFVYTQPSGYNALQTNNLAEPTIKNGKEHFEAVTFTGNATQRDITGLEFQPDLVFAKNTATSGHWNWHDSVRGATKRLTSNSSAAETTYSDYLNAFNSDGFSVGTEGAINGNGNKIVAYCFKAGGTAVSNTDGTITSSVSANTDAGFSIVSYTGTTTNGATIGHGLNSAPEFIIVKDRDNTRQWAVYHESVGNSSALFLNEPDAQASTTSLFWNSTSPTSSVFTVGTSATTNASANYIAYCWHSVEGFSKFGKYTGNGDADGTFIYTGFSPAFIIYKKINAANSWHMIDNKRDTFNPAIRTVYADDTATEGSTYIRFDFCSNGFKQRSSYDANNASGSEYIYMAFAESPFGGENQPPATAR